MSQIEVQAQIQEMLSENPFLEETETSTSEKYKALDSGKAEFIEETLKDSTSLQEHLNRQIHDFRASRPIKDFLFLLVSSLDEQGFSRIPHKELFRFAKLEKTLQREAIQFARKLDPRGVGAEDTWEALEWQAMEAYPEDHLLPDIIQVLKQRDSEGRVHKRELTDEIARMFFLKESEVADLFQKLGELDPFPARNYIRTQENYVYPEIFYMENENKIDVLIRQEMLPGLRINSDLYTQYKGSETSEVWTQKYREAENFLNGLQYRHESIKKLAHCVLKKQIHFFQRGPNYLKPMNLTDVASEINVHISTVSRIVSHKYFECRWGIFPLKILFPSGIKTTSGDRISVEDFKLAIIRAISEEDKSKPLSDEKISRLLLERGIDARRRTVAKYRQILGIPSSTGRRK